MPNYIQRPTYVEELLRFQDKQLIKVVTACAVYAGKKATNQLWSLTCGKAVH